MFSCVGHLPLNLSLFHVCDVLVDTSDAYCCQVTDERVLCFRCSRVYWSTRDARRRCIYTCRVTEIRPTVKTRDVKIQDLTIVHDENHSDYVPLGQLDLKALGLPSLMPSSGKGGEKTLDDVVMVSDSLQCVSASGSAISQTSVVFSSRMRSPSCAESVTSASDTCGETWRSPLPTAGGINLDVLSPNTLKYLGSAALSKIKSQPAPRSTMENDFGNLTKMVNRLNSAAGRMSGTHPASAGPVGKRPASAERSICQMSPAPREKVRRSSSCDSPSSSFKQAVLKPLQSRTPASVAEIVTHKVIEIDDSAQPVGLSNVEQTRAQPNRPIIGELSDSKLIKPTVTEVSDFEPIKSVVTELSDSKPVGSTVTEGSKADPVEVAVTDRSSSEPLSCSSACLEAVSEEEALVEEALRSVPEELLEECRGHTIVVLTEDTTDLTEEQMIQLAQEALETDSVTTTSVSHDQSPPETDSVTTTSVSHDQSPPETDSVTTTSVSHDQSPPETVDACVAAVILSETDTTSSNTEADRPYLQPDTATENTSLKAEFVQYAAGNGSILADSVSDNGRSVAVRDADFYKQSKNTSSQHNDETNEAGSETAGSNLVAGKEMLAREVSSLERSDARREAVTAVTCSLTEYQGVSRQHTDSQSVSPNQGESFFSSGAAQSVNVPKIVEEILCRDFGNWIPPVTSDNSKQTSTKTLESDALCETPLVQKGGGNENRKREAKNKRNVNVEKQSKNIKLEETSQNTDSRMTNSNFKSVPGGGELTLSVLQNVGNTMTDNTDAVRTAVDCAIQSNIQHKSVSVGCGPGQVTPSKKGHIPAEDVPVFEAHGALNSNVTDKSADAGRAKKHRSLSGSSSIRTSMEILSSLSDGSTSQMCPVEAALLREGSKHVEPVYINGRMIGYHVREKEPKISVKAALRMHLAKESSRTREADLMEKAQQESAELVAIQSKPEAETNNVLPQPSGEERGFADPCEENCKMSCEGADQSGSQKNDGREVESAEVEGTVNVQESAEVEGTVKVQESTEGEGSASVQDIACSQPQINQSVGTGVAREEHGIQKVVCSVSEMNSEVCSASREDTVEKTKPNKTQAHNCIDNKEDIGKDVNSADCGFSDDGVPTKDVCSKRDRIKKEPVKKYPLRRTIQRVIGDIDMEELATKSRPARPKASTSGKEASSCQPSEPLCRDDTSLTDDNVQDKGNVLVRRTRSRSGNIHPGDGNTNMKSENTKIHSEKIRLEEENKKHGGPCARTEKVSNAVIQCVNTEQESKIESNNAATGHQQNELTVKREPSSKITTRRVSVRLEKLSDSIANFESYDQDMKGKESTVKVSSRQTSLQRESLKSEPDVEMKYNAGNDNLREVKSHPVKSDLEVKNETEKSDLDTKNRKVKIESDIKSNATKGCMDVMDDPAKDSRSSTILEKIAEKIKAESMAKRSADEKGPFKCGTCRRLYRTEESYTVHTLDCTFEVSTSDDDDDDVAVDGDNSQTGSNPTDHVSKGHLDDGERNDEDTDSRKLLLGDCSKQNADHLLDDTMKKCVEKESSESGVKDSENKNIEGVSKTFPPVGSSGNVQKRGRGRPPKPKTTELTVSARTDVLEQDVGTLTRARLSRRSTDSSDSSTQKSAEFPIIATAQLTSLAPKDDVEMSGKTRRSHRHPLTSDSSAVPAAGDSLMDSLPESLQGSSQAPSPSPGEEESSLHTKRWVKMRKSKLRRCSVTKWSAECCDTIKSICPKDTGDTSSGKKRHRKRRKRCATVSSNATENEDNSSEHHNEEVIVIHIETSSSNSEHEADSEMPDINCDSAASVPQTTSVSEELEANQAQSSEDVTSVGDCISAHLCDTSSTQVGISVTPSSRKSVSSPSSICQGLKEKLGRKTPEILAAVSSRRASLDKKDLELCKTDTAGESGDQSPQSPESPFLDELTGEMMIRVNGKIVPLKGSKDTSEDCTGQANARMDTDLGTSSDGKKDLDEVTVGTNLSAHPRNIFDVLSVDAQDLMSDSKTQTETLNAQTHISEKLQISGKSNMAEVGLQISDVCQGTDVESADQHAQSVIIAARKNHLPAGVTVQHISLDIPQQKSVERLLTRDTAPETPVPSRRLIPSPLTVGNQASNGAVPKPLAIKKPKDTNVPMAALQSPVPKPLSVGHSSPADGSRLKEWEGSTKTVSAPPGQHKHHTAAEPEPVVVFPSSTMAARLKMADSSKYSPKPSGSEDSIKIATEILRQKYLEKQKIRIASPSPCQINMTTPVVPCAVVSQTNTLTGQGSCRGVSAGMQHNKASIIETALRQLQQINPGLVNTAAQQLAYTPPSQQLNQLNVPSLQMPFINNPSNLSALQMTGVGNQSAISALQMAAVNTQSNVHMSGLQMSNIPVQASSSDVSSLKLPAQYSAIQTNAGMFVHASVGQGTAADVTYQQAPLVGQQLPADPTMLQRLASALQQMSHVVPAQPLPQQLFPAPQAVSLAPPPVLHTTPLLQCSPGVLQQAVSLVPQPQVVGHGDGQPAALHTPAAFGLTSSNVSYMGSFMLPKVDQRLPGCAGDVAQISDSLMTCVPSPMMQQSSVATSIHNIGTSSTGRPVIKVVIENKDCGQVATSSLPLPVQNLVKAIKVSSSSPDVSTNVRVVCKTTRNNTVSQQTVYSRLPAASLIQTLSHHATGPASVGSSESNVQQTSRSSSPRVLKYTVTPSSPNLRKILSSRVASSGQPTMLTSASGVAQKVVVSRMSMLKKLVNKPNILHRKRHASAAQGTPAHKRQTTSAVSGGGSRSVKYIVKRSLHPDKYSQHLTSAEGHSTMAAPVEVMARKSFQDERVADQTEGTQTEYDRDGYSSNVEHHHIKPGHIQKRKIVQKIPGYLEDLLLKQNKWGEGQGIARPDINRALLDLSRASVPSSPSSTSSSQGNSLAALNRGKMVTAHRTKVTTAAPHPHKADRVRRSPKKGQSLLDRSKSCDKKASDFTKLKLGRKPRTRRKSPVRVRTVCHSPAGTARFIS